MDFGEAIKHLKDGKRVARKGWTKEELENMLEDVVNELDLSGEIIEGHGPQGTTPAELVRIVLEQKDREIRMLKQGFVSV